MYLVHHNLSPYSIFIVIREEVKDMAENEVKRNKRNTVCKGWQKKEREEKEKGRNNRNEMRMRETDEKERGNEIWE